MGGGPDHEHMLILLANPEPKELITKIKERFPYIEVTYLQTQGHRSNQVPEGEKGVPKGSSSPSLIFAASVPDSFLSYHLVSLVYSYEPSLILSLELWQKATIIVTLSTLPPTAAECPK